MITLNEYARHHCLHMSVAFEGQIACLNRALPVSLHMQEYLVSMYDTCMCGSHGGQKRMLDSLSLELEMVASCCVGAEN